MIKSVVSSFFSDYTPIQLMIEHVKIVGEVGDEMEKLVVMYLDHDDISEMVKFITNKENEADEVKFKLRNLLAQKKVKVPFPKIELIHAMHLQDDIIDLMRDIAKRMSINYLDFALDKKAKQDFSQLVKEVRKAIGHLEDEVNGLKFVMNSAFAKQERKKGEKEIVKIEELESRIDKLSLKIGKWVYSRKEKLNPLDLLFFDGLVQMFAEISDKAENLAEMLRSFTR